MKPKALIEFSKEGAKANCPRWRDAAIKAYMMTALDCVAQRTEELMKETPAVAIKTKPRPGVWAQQRLGK